MAFVGGDVADDCNNRKAPFCLLVLCLSRGSWLADPAAVVSSLDKHQYHRLFFAVLGGNSSIQQSVLLLFGIIFYLWKKTTWKFTSPRTRTHSKRFLVHLKLITPAAAAALCSVQIQLMSRFGNDFDFRYIKSPHCPENIGWIVLLGSVQVRLQLPQGKNTPPWLAWTYFLALADIIPLCH